MKTLLICLVALVLNSSTIASLSHVGMIVKKQGKVELPVHFLQKFKPVFPILAQNEVIWFNASFCLEII